MQTSLYDHQFLASDQPQTCPSCGLRTDILADFSHTNSRTQIHQCPNERCGRQFGVSIEEEQELYFTEEPD